MGDTARAESDYTQALTLKPDVLVYHNRALARQAQKQWQAALEDYDAALALQPQSAEVIKDRGNLLRRMQQEGLVPPVLGRN